MKITIGINTLHVVQYSSYTNHIQFFYNLGKKGHEVVLVNPSRMSIDRMRNMSAKVAIETGSDYLLFLDDDVIVPKDGLEKLIALDSDIAAGNVIIRGYPFNYMVFKYDKHDVNLKPLTSLGGETVECDAVGFSFCLIKTEILKQIKEPWFVTGLTNTEDIYFCIKAKRKIPSLSIHVDPSVVCRHILWDEVISEENRENYKEYFEKQFQIEPDDSNDVPYEDLLADDRVIIK